MSIEFVGESGDGFENLLGGLFQSLMGEKPIQGYSETPDPDRYVSVLDLLKDHGRRLDEARQDTESGMLTPRVTIREHSDIHLILHALDHYMSEVDKEWYDAVAAHGIGNDSETLENLTLRSREITDAAALRHELDRVHKAWAREHATPMQEEFVSAYPDVDSGDSGE